MKISTLIVVSTLFSVINAVMLRPLPPRSFAWSRVACRCELGGRGTPHGCTHRVIADRIETGTFLCAVAAAVGKGRFFSYREPRDVFEELRRASTGGPADYSGITYERLDAPDGADGVFWPCPAVDHPGTPRLFADSFPTPSGRAPST